MLAEWRKALQSVVPLDPGTLPEWGPTEDEILQARIMEITPSTINKEGNGWFADSIDHGTTASALSSDDEGADLELDSILIDTLEAVDFADVFRQTGDHEF